MSAQSGATDDDVEEGPSAAARAVVAALNDRLAQRLDLMEQRWGRIPLGPEPRRKGLHLTIGAVVGEHRPRSYPAVQVGVSQMLGHVFLEWGQDGAPVSTVRYQAHAWIAVEGTDLDKLSRARERLLLATRHALTVQRSLGPAVDVERNSTRETYLSPPILALDGATEQPSSVVLETRMDFVIVAVERPSVPVLGTADTIALTAERLSRE